MHAKDRTDAEQLTAVVLASLDEEGATGNLARRAYRSRSQFYRLFRALVEESPGTILEPCGGGFCWNAPLGN